MAPLVFPNDSVLLKLNGVLRTLHFYNHANVTLTPSVVPGEWYDQMMFYLDATGKLYLSRSCATSDENVMWLTYEQAVNQNGVY